jgi:hypothetical protein
MLKKSHYKYTILQGNWQDNWDQCCQIGMKPFVLDEAEEFQCFNSLLKGSAERKINIFVINFAAQ